MKSHFSFRPVEEWKSALMLLPDNNFFELLRSVFGNIKTPFNKQRLLNDLFALLSRGDIQETISSFLDDQDRMVISAVALLNEPTSAELETFFSGDLDSVELDALLVNLEERLILYRFREKDVLRLTCNPVFKSVLEPIIADAKLLFLSFPAGRASAAKSEAPRESDSAAKSAGKKSAVMPEAKVWINDARIMAALFAFVLHEEELFKEEGGLRRKALDAGKKLFGGMDLELAVRILIKLELFYIDGHALVPRRERINDFALLSFLERQEYWAAGLYFCLAENDTHDGMIPVQSIRSGVNRSKLQRAATFIHCFIASLDAERLFPKTTLKRLAGLVEKTGVLQSPLPIGSDMKISFELFLDVAEKTGLLESAGNCWKPVSQLDSGEGHEKKHNNKKEDSPVIVMDTDFSFILYPEISFADALALGTFCSVKSLDGAAVSSEITCRSAVHAFDLDMKADAMISLLDRLSGGRVDENLRWTLNEWEKRYAAVSLDEGIVLTLAKEQSYLAEAGPVSSLIKRTLAPGVYLLSCGKRSEAAGVLRRAGIDIVAMPFLAADSENAASRFFRNYFPSLQASNAISLNNAEAEKAALPASREKAEAIKEEFRGVLEKMKLTKQERDELLARIDRRLILTAAQLQGTFLRYEKLEANGLDYAGKAAIAKQAYDSGSLVEVHWPVAGEGSSRVIGKIQAMEKKEGDSVLVIKTRTQENNVYRISLGKISLLRRIKQSIFGE